MRSGEYMDWRKVPLRTKADSRVLIVEKAFVYPCEDGSAIYIKPGFCTDGASIPRVFWNLLDPLDPDYRQAAILHDGLYASQLLSREESDELFLRAMHQEGCGWFKRHLVYRNVRMFGGTAWEEKDPEGIAYNRGLVSIISLKERE